MGKKRNRSEPQVANEAKKEEGAAERPRRTLLGFKDKVENKWETEFVGCRNKKKVLVTCSRRISFRCRHLMLNVVSLLPHCKTDNKVESKNSKGTTLNELVDLKSCSSCLFFECRKGRNLYYWMSKCPSGPSVKFLVDAVHTMEELKLTGNHLKGSRPIPTFSTDFNTLPHWKLLKEMIMQKMPPRCEPARNRGHECDDHQNQGAIHQVLADTLTTLVTQQQQQMAQLQQQ